MHEASSLAIRAEKQVTLAFVQIMRLFLFIQAEVYNQLCVDGFLTDEEKDVLRWGRNAKKASSTKRAATLAIQDYKKATAFECLVSSPANLLLPNLIYYQLGYLYLSDMDRLHALMEHLGYTKTTECEK